MLLAAFRRKASARISSGLWLMVAAASFLAASAVPVLCNFLVDPFQLIRHSDVYVVSQDSQRAVNAGIIHTAPPFDAAVVGTSYVGNMEPGLVKNLFGFDTRVLSVFGATQKEVSATLRYLLKQRPGLKLVFVETSIWNVCDLGDHAVWPFPTGLYEREPIALIKHFAAWSTVRWSLWKLQFAAGRRVSQFSSDPRAAHRWFEAMEKYFSSPENLKASIEKDALSQSGAVLSGDDIEIGGNVVLDCFEKNVLNIAAAHPQTKFILFNPPVLQQVQWGRARRGLIDAWNRAQERLAERIRDLGNVRYFDFYAAHEIGDDCSRFMDVAHFDQATSDQLLRWMREGRYERTPETNAAMSEAVRSSVREPKLCPFQTG